MAKPIEEEEEAGPHALHLLKSTEPPLWLLPSESLSKAARTASQHLFSLLKPHAHKSLLDQLLVDGFDAEQIWQQIDLQSQPLVSRLRRKVKNFENNPEDIGIVDMNVVVDAEKKALDEIEGELPLDDDDVDMDDFDEDDDEEEEEGDEGEEENGGLEDKFLKIDEMREFLEEDEAREYGLDLDKNKKTKRGDLKRNVNDDDEDEEEDQEEEDEDEDDELGLFGEGNEDDEEGDSLGNARYEDFFGAKKKTVTKRKSKLTDGSEEDSDFGDEQDNEEVDEKKSGLSTHEKQLQQLRLEIEQMEKANLEPKNWPEQGEVTAASRPKNSALEVDLDYERNARPAPVITEEVTASLEEMIKNRIIEGRFEDIQKVPSLQSKAPKEMKELDDNKSKKGLAEVYEDEYVQKTNPAAAPLSFTDEQKKEASILFKKLCLKLDALSHFHFAPKPVIEDMSIHANVPALAMEEIAPMAVSDAAMLAPEEVFSGKGDIKEEAELTQAERKRRRANKKRKFKVEAAKRVAKKARDNPFPNHNDDNEE